MDKILAIDDKADNLVTLCALLKNLMPGCTVITAQSGREGSRTAVSELPDVILLDVKMPDMDGFETCRRLKSDILTKHIPVIMVTAIRTDTRSRITGLEVGADAFLAKPIDPYELASQVKAVLRIKKAEDALREERNSLERMVKKRTVELEKKQQLLMKEIEERRRTEEKLRKSEDTLLRAQRVAKIGSWWYDPAIRKSTWTEEMTHILGFETKNAELDYEEHRKIIHPDDWDRFDSTIEKAVSDGVGYDLELRIIRSSGEVRHINTKCFAEKNEAGKVVQLIGTTQDITNRKETDSRLRQAQKMESIGTLAGGIAHDFNNILFPLLGYAEMLKDEIQADSPLQEYIDGILHAATRSKDLVQRILTVSRKGDQSTRPVRLHAVIDEALDLLRSTLPTTIEIQREIDTTCGIVMADPTQIHQIVMNLATNAYHAMEDTGGVLTVRLEQLSMAPFDTELPQGDYALLTVSDNGVGIAEDVMGNIYDPYFTTKGIGKGTGLGLSVVLGIVKKHDGDIQIESEPGKGTEIRVYLPIKAQRREPYHVKDNGPVPGGTETILLVDDEAAVARMERIILERLGYRVTLFTESSMAFEAFKSDSDSFDLVLTDMTMPGMTGVQLAQELLSIRPDIPVVICTGYSEKLSREKAGSMGVKGILMKPVAKSDMAKMVRKVLDSPDG